MVALFTRLVSSEFLFSNIGRKQLRLAPRRTFSLLLIAAILERDTVETFLSPQTINELVPTVGRYLDQERVWVGYSRQIGWVHAMAHTADVILEILRSSKSTEASRSHLLQIVENALLRSRFPWSFGEDERLCTAVSSLLGGYRSLVIQHLNSLRSNVETSYKLDVIVRRNHINYLKGFLIVGYHRKDSELVKLCEKELGHVLSD